MAAGGERFPKAGFPPLLFGRDKKPSHLFPVAARAVEEFLVAGCNVHADPSVPKDELHLEDENGERLLTVKGLER